MKRHEPEHETWIEALALNERERIPERLREALEGCEECAARVEEFNAARAALDSAAAQMRADLEAAAQAPRRADEDERVRRYARLDARPTRRRTLAWALSIAALLAVFAAGYFLARPSEHAPRSQHLGSTRINGLSGALSAGVFRLEWQANTLGDESQLVDVRYVDARGVEHSFASGMLFEPRWQFEATRVAGAVGQISWRVSLSSPGRAARESSDWVSLPLSQD